VEEIVLEAERRAVIGKQVKALRRAGKLPAIIYGRKLEPMPIMLDQKEASRVIERASGSALIVVQLDGEKHYTLVREKQRNPILGTLRHIDFQAVSLTEKVRANVPLHFTGEAPAVENYFGVVVTNIEQVEVECLPRDLPERFEIDLSSLEEIGDVIHVGELVTQKGVVVLDDPETIVVLVTAPISEAELEEEEAEAVAGEEPEVIEKGKKEEEGEEEEGSE
jgi:large subunit ribosomal protein L25